MLKKVLSSLFLTLALVIGASAVVAPSIVTSANPYRIKIENLALRVFLCDAKQYFESMPNLTVLNAIEAELIRLDKIVDWFNHGKFIFMHQKFVATSNAFKAKKCSEIGASDLRFLRSRLENFDKVLKNYSKQYKNSSSSDEAVLLEDITHLITFLQEQLLKDDVFGIDFIDNFIDTAFVRPFEWGKKNPEILVTAALLPLTLGGIYKIINVSDTSDDIIVSDFMKANIPADVFEQKYIARQEGASCGGVAVARALQRILKIPEGQTVAFRNQKFKEWDAWMRARKSETDLAKIPVGSFQIFNWIDNNDVEDLINLENIKLSTNNQSNIVFVDYSHMLLDIVRKRFALSMDGEKTKLFSGAIPQINVVVGPIRRTTKPDGGAHFLHYEITRSGGGSAWFHICSEDSLHLDQRSQWGAEFLYNYFMANSMDEWLAMR